MREPRDIKETIDAYADTVLRVCTLYSSQPADRDDAFQETFLKYAQSNVVFNGEEHRKAWLIRVATNVCRDTLRAQAGSGPPIESVDEGRISRDVNAQEDTRTRLIESLQQLDEKYRVPLYLKYYEGYTAAEIGEMLGQPESTVYTNLARGRKKLEEVLAHGE